MKNTRSKHAILSRAARAFAIGLFGVSLGAALGYAQQAAPKSDSAPAGDVEKGKTAFKRHSCFSCHGHSGNGGSGPRIAQNPIPFPAFRKYVRRPAKSMPPFGTLVTDAELADIYAFLKSIPPSPALKDIPLLKE